MIDDLGGTIKIAQAKATLSTEMVKEAFLGNNKQAQKQVDKTLVSSGVFEGMTKASEKVLFGVSVYFTDNAFHPFAGRLQRFKEAP